MRVRRRSLWRRHHHPIDSGRPVGHDRRSDANRPEGGKHQAILEAVNAGPAAEPGP